MRLHALACMHAPPQELCICHLEFMIKSGELRPHGHPGSPEWNVRGHAWDGGGGCMTEGAERLLCWRGPFPWCQLVG